MRQKLSILAYVFTPESSTVGHALDNLSTKAVSFASIAKVRSVVIRAVDS